MPQKIIITGKVTMDKLSLKELAVPMIKAIDSFNYLLKSHHRRVAVISYHIGKQMNLKEDELFELVVAAALHDIGALSVQERDMLIQDDVTNPKPHCIVGYRMLGSFEAFKTIAQIIKHHHIVYEDSARAEPGEVMFQSHILHLADRVDILISPDEFILNQKAKVTEGIREKVGTTFHPEVFEAFVAASKSDIFWIDINNMDIDQLFRKLNFSLDFELTADNVIDFAITLSRIIDFRSRFTSSHSYTVAHLAHLIGSYFDFDDERCKKLMVAGYLHDIGKIGIDPGIIEKKGPLTDDEFNLMKLHAYYTGQILNELSVSDWFAEIVTWSERHHEKVTGNGYPFSLGEESIDQGTKILAYSDIISALMEERPYRESLSIDVAFDIIKNKICDSLSADMFGVIEEHKEEINRVVQSCQNFANTTYQDTIEMATA
ncbi:HD domain-containing protein [Vibrio sp. JC009]|uniref:HD-GYP domain-containing protein n=1 Tax=Vibrio sp. JC009 TaxID=2912314 RepID=UPI0023AF3E3A|nr:HD domain-containing phosphohydrolase [Vibrio sp. JC009]WED23834.1 HD domain-containing protein [Vibrio sp. JC009]